MAQYLFWAKTQGVQEVYNGFLGPYRLGGAAGERDGGRSPVGGRFRQLDRTSFLRHTPAFGLRLLRKNGYILSC